MPSSSAKRVVPGGSRPRDARTHAVPIVGWPANGSSRRGVKILTRKAHSGLVAGRMKVVSERFISSAIACISSSRRSRPSRITARGFPPSGRSVKTSTWTRA